MKGMLRWKRSVSNCSSGQRTTAPDTMLTGNLQLGWEIPSRVIGQNIREWLLGSPGVTLKDGVVHLGRYENEVVKFYGSVGSRVLEGVISTLESPGGTYSMLSSELLSGSVLILYEFTEDSEFEIATSPDLLKCSYSTMDPEFLSYLRQTLSWICLTNRNEITSHITLSTGRWIIDTFCLDLTDVAYWYGSG